MKKIFLSILFFIFLAASQAFSADEEILFIFDASASMADNFYGTPKYEIAAREIKNMADRLGNSSKIGLRKIGITIDASILNYLQNPNEMCTATQLTVPIRQNSVNYLKSSLTDIFPLGTTPLEYTLKLALNSDFSRTALIKHIILVTDGADSCNGDPCRYARATMMQRKDVIIDIIAIGVNDIEVQQLKCITDAANGKLFKITNPKELEQAFDSIYTNINSAQPSTAVAPAASVTPVLEQPKLIQQEISQPPAENLIKYKNYCFEINE